MKLKLSEKIFMASILFTVCSLFTSWTMENVNAASKTTSWSVENKERVQYHELPLPSDFSKVDSIQTNTGSVMSYTVDEVNKKLKVTVGSGTRSRNENQYSGSITGNGGASAGQYMSSGFILWYSIDNNPPIYNVQMRYKYRNSTDWSNWVGAGSDCFSEDMSTGYRSSCYWGMSYYVEYYDTVQVEFRAATSMTTTTFYQYDITLNYSTNSDPVITSTTTNNQQVSEVSGYNKLAISGTVKDTDANNVLTVKYSIDGTTHTGKTLQTLTANGSNQSFAGNVTIDSTIPTGTRTLRVWVEDNKGGKSAEQTRTFIVDKIKPTIAFDPIKRKADFTDIETQLAIQDTGGAGYGNYRYAWTKEETKPTTGWTDWISTANPLVTHEKSGKWYLHVEAKDKVGNVAYTYSGIYEKISAGGGPSVNINTYPVPTGTWSNQSINLYIMENGDSELLANATKMYEVTNSSVPPNTFGKIVPTDKKITLNLVGENFVHVQYVLEDGTKMTSSSGPYLMDTSDVGNFTMKLTNNAGVGVTTWTKESLKLVMSNPITTSVSGYVKQYRIEGVHTEWQTYRDGIIINLEGKNRIFGRIINGAGQVSVQQAVVSNVDLTPPTVQQVRLSTKENGRYEVSVQATDAGSGVEEVLLNNGTVLTKNGQTYLSNVLTTKPTSITVKDQAGNVTSVIPFEAEPTITFSGGYSPTLPSYRGDVTVTITGATRYLVGAKEYLCAQSNCEFTVKGNVTITAIQENGTSETRKVIAMTNIDKTPLALVLNGKRNVSDPLKIEFQWNYALADAKLVCYEAGVQKTFTVNGKTHSFAGKNVVYDCTVSGVYGGETLQSNHIKIFTDATITTGGGVLIQEIPKKNNVHIDQMATGDAYMINAKSDNYKETQLPFPKDILVPKTNP